jgi:uncharacterized membrane protein
MQPNPESASFLARKERAVAEDLKTAFSGYDRLVRQVGEVPTWTVTLEVAALGVLLSGKLAHAMASLVPAMLALAAFMILELRARSSMRFNKDEVMAIERIFMIGGQLPYAEAISKYEFRDLRLSNLSRATKLLHLSASAFDLNVGLWYGFWATVILFECFWFLRN